MIPSSVGALDYHVIFVYHTLLSILTCGYRRKIHSKMPTPVLDDKKRPPPIAIPLWPPSRTAPEQNASTKATRQTEAHSRNPQRFASSSTQAVEPPQTNTPLTSPLQLDEAGICEARGPVSKSSSQTSRHLSPAMTTLSDLVDQARLLHHKLDNSSMPSQHDSTARSRQSERSHHSAAAAQAKFEALGGDETTTRSQIESCSEKQLFKMTGQIPPTPIAGT